MAHGGGKRRDVPRGIRHKSARGRSKQDKKNKREIILIRPDGVPSRRQLDSEKLHPNKWDHVLLLELR